MTNPLKFEVPVRLRSYCLNCKREVDSNPCSCLKPILRSEDRDETTSETQSEETKVSKRT